MRKSVENTRLVWAAERIALSGCPINVTLSQQWEGENIQQWITGRLLSNQLYLKPSRRQWDTCVTESCGLIRHIKKDNKNTGRTRLWITCCDDESVNFTPRYLGRTLVKRQCWIPQNPGLGHFCHTCGSSQHCFAQSASLISRREVYIPGWRTASFTLALVGWVFSWYYVYLSQTKCLFFL